MIYHHFSFEEREKIQEVWWECRSIRCIVRVLERSPASVSRELRRNFPKERQVYTPRIAHERALQHRTHRGRLERLKNSVIRAYVTTHLKEGWPPEQIAGRIRLDLYTSISHEAICQYIYAQVHQHGWGLLRPGKEDLRPYLRFKRKRRMKKGMRNPQRCRYIRGISIEQRPLAVAARARMGDWEGDTVVSKDQRPRLNTLVERVSGMVFMTQLVNNTGEATAEAVARRLSSLPDSVRHTLALDNGPENS